VTCYMSPISAAAHAGCQAVADSLRQAVALQCQVLEATLLFQQQQQQQQQQVPLANISSVSVDPVSPEAAAAAAMPASTPGGKQAKHQQQQQHSLRYTDQLTFKGSSSDVPGKLVAAAALGGQTEGVAGKKGGEGHRESHGARQEVQTAVVVVDGIELDRELSRCWLSCYQAIAEADLSVAQMGQWHHQLP
jgi:hypothetical protein